VIVAGEARLPDSVQLDGPAWIGRDAQVGEGARLMGPVVLGDGARVGERAQLRDSILFPGTHVAPGAIVIGAIAGHAGILESLRRR
jgi:mannose-1-phosphate guanylyltransferase